MGNFKSNVIVVFIGSLLGNVFNLLSQLLLAHRLIPADFAAFNALLSISMLFSAPLGTLQTAIVKYTADFRVRKESDRIRSLFSRILKVVFFADAGILLVFLLSSEYLVRELKIPSLLSCYILGAMVFVSFLMPVFLGAAQGFEFFGWFTAASLISSVFKFGLVFLFLLLGWGINGALGAFAFATFMTGLIAYIPVRDFVSLRDKAARIDWRGFLTYFIPVAISLFCFTGLVSFDMILVKKYFSPEQSGIYSLAQMVGKIFLFLPSAISVVLFPRTAVLNARNQDARGTLRQALVMASVLCLAGIIFYNLFPGFVLTVLVGRASAEIVLLGRLFSISMSLFALVYMIILYLLSLRDARFIKYLVISSIAQYLLIVFLHGSLPVVQLVVCINAAVFLCILCVLAFKMHKYAR